MPVDSGWKTVALGALEALVALDAAVGRIRGFALFPGDRHAADAAVTR
jgi:hypothetical protein